MIGKLSGRVDALDSDHLIIDVGGVGYLVFASARTLAACEPGAAISLIIETHVREDHIHLYGFVNRAERDTFRLLTTVQGVGVRMALAILGLYAPEQLQTIIAAQDKSSLTAVSGVGPKLAERMITELKRKVGELNLSGVVLEMAAAPAAKKGKKAAASTAAAPAASSAETEDAVSALVNLGYGRAEAFSAVARAQHQGESGLDALIKAGLKELSA